MQCVSDKISKSGDEWGWCKPDCHLDFDKYADVLQVGIVCTKCFLISHSTLNLGGSAECPDSGRVSPDGQRRKLLDRGEWKGGNLHRTQEKVSHPESMIIFTFYASNYYICVTFPASASRRSTSAMTAATSTSSGTTW